MSQSTLLPLKGQVLPATLPVQAYRISLPEEVLDALRALQASAAANQSIQVTLDGSDKGLTVASQHFPFTLVRELSQDLLTRTPLLSSGEPGRLIQLGQIRRECTIPPQLSTRAFQRVQQRSHEVEGERKGRKAILLENVPVDVENARGKKGKRGTAKPIIGKRILPPARPVNVLAAKPVPPTPASTAATKPVSSAASTPHSRIVAPLPIRAGASTPGTAAPSTSSTPNPSQQQAGGKSPLLMKIIHRLAHKSLTLKDLSKLIGAPKVHISKVLSTVAWTIGPATNPDNKLWSLKDNGWLDIDLFSPFAPQWTTADKERIYKDTLAAFGRLGLPEGGRERMRLEEMWARVRGVEPKGLGIRNPEEKKEPAPAKPEITLTPAKDDATPKGKEKAVPAPIIVPASRPSSSSGSSAPASQSNAPMLTSSGIAIGGTLSSSFRGGLAKGKDSKVSSKPTSASASTTSSSSSAPLARKALSKPEPLREDMEEGELEDEPPARTPTKPAPAPAPLPAAKSKYPGSVKATPSKSVTPVATYEKPTVSSASKLKEKDKDKEKAPVRPPTSVPVAPSVPATSSSIAIKLDTPDKVQSKRAVRPSDARPGADISRPASALSKPHTVEVKVKEPEVRKKRAADDDLAEQDREAKKRKTEDKVPKKAKKEITARDERVVSTPASASNSRPPVSAATVTSVRKEKEQEKEREKGDVPIKKPAALRKEDSSLERERDRERERKTLPVTKERKENSSLERKPLVKEKKEAPLAERDRERRPADPKPVIKKPDTLVEKKAAKRKQVDYSEDDDDPTPVKKMKTVAAAKKPMLREDTRPRVSTTAPIVAKERVPAKPATNGESSKREPPTRPAVADKGKRKRPDYTSSDDDRDEETRRVVRRKTVRSAPAKDVNMDAGPSTSTRVTVSTKPKPEPRSEPKSEPKPKTKPETIVDPKPRPATDVAPSAVSEHPLPSSPPTEDQLLIKSLRKYSRYVEAYAKIVQQKQIYEDVAAGRRPLDDPKLYSPEQMEPIVRDYQRQHTAIQALYDKMDEMRAAAASSSTPSVGSKP